MCVWVCVALCVCAHVCVCVHGFFVPSSAVHGKLGRPSVFFILVYVCSVQLRKTTLQICVCVCVCLCVCSVQLRKTTLQICVRVCVCVCVCADRRDRENSLA